MSAEREILNFWLNQKGYFTINKIKEKNKDIGILGIKFSSQKPSFIHFVVTLSVRSTFLESGNVEKSVSAFGKEYFSDPDIVSAMKTLIERHTGSKDSYKKSVVLGLIPADKRKEVVEQFLRLDIEVIEFTAILSEVVNSLGTHYYRDDVIRSLQLVKFLLLQRPAYLAKLLEKEQLNINKQGKLMELLLQQEGVKKTLSRESGEEQLIQLLKHSTLRRPEKLARVIADEILGSRSKRKFLIALLAQEGMHRMFTQPEEAEAKILGKDQKKMDSFF
jgi:hypothetical protein